MRAFDLANLGITFPFSSESSNYLVITETLQQVDSDTLEATSASQNYLVFSIFCAVHVGNREEWGVGIFLTYIQRLKQLGFSLDTLGDAEPAAIFRWVCLLLEKLSRSSLGLIRSTLQILLSFGADINARCCGVPPLVYLFGIPECIHRVDEEANTDAKESDTDDEESNTTIVTEIATEIAIVLLESGADLLALTDNGASVFDAAECRGSTSELALALQKTGYDLDEVRQKIRLAQWGFFHPRCSLAKSTAVDRSQIKPPSTAGLVSRRAVAGDRLEE